MAPEASIARDMPLVRRRAALLIASLVVAVGVAGFVAASNEPFRAHLGLPLWHILHFNRLGATATIAIGALAAIGAAVGRRLLVAIAGYFFAAAWVLTLIQTGRSNNWLGGRGDTLAFFMAAAIGLVMIALVPSEVPAPAAPLSPEPFPPERSDAGSP